MSRAFRLVDDNDAEIQEIIDDNTYDNYNDYNDLY